MFHVHVYSHSTRTRRASPTAAPSIASRTSHTHLLVTDVHAHDRLAYAPTCAFSTLAPPQTKIPVSYLPLPRGPRAQPRRVRTTRASCYCTHFLTDGRGPHFWALLPCNLSAPHVYREGDTLRTLLLYFHILARHRTPSHAHARPRTQYEAARPGFVRFGVWHGETDCSCNGKGLGRTEGCQV